METAWPATVAVPVRSTPVPFVEIARLVDPLPVAPAEVNEAKEGAAAVHAQLEGLAVTLTGIVPPVLSTFTAVGVTAKLHPPAWLTGTACPASIAMPLCVGPNKSPAAVMVSEPLPVPPVALNVIHGGAIAVHAQVDELATIVRTAAPPVLGKNKANGETENVHPLLVLSVIGTTMPAIVTEPDSALPVVLVAALT
jgi:hypothetical protein